MKKGYCILLFTVLLFTGLFFTCRIGLCYLPPPGLSSWCYLFYLDWLLRVHRVIIDVRIIWLVSGSWTVVLEKTFESPLDCKKIQPVHPKGDQSWVFIGKTDVEAETPILWPPDVKSWLIGKDPDAGKDWGQEEKGTTEDEMVGWHHWLNGHEFE